MTGFEKIVAIVDAAAPPAAPASSPPAPSASASSAAKPKPSQTGGSRRKARVTRGRGRDRELGARIFGGPVIDTIEDEEQLDVKLAFYPLTDLGNAERFRERYRGRFVYSPEIGDEGGYLWWDGKRWRRDGADERVKIAEHETVRAIQREAKAIRGTKKDKKVGAERDGTPIMQSDKLAKWGRASEASNKLTPIARRAAPYLAIEAGRFDADPWMINVDNGTLVISKDFGGDYVELRDHDPANLITKLAPVVYDPAATCPLYDTFIARVQPEHDMRAFLHRWMGYSLTGDAGEQKFVVFWGGGRNGKGVFVEACAHVAGDYADAVPIETFLTDARSRVGGQATPDLMLLLGARLLRTTEPNKGSVLDEALIKSVTGGDPIQARNLNSGYVRFKPYFKLTVSGQHRPKISGGDEGIWGRVLLVPWNVFIPLEERDLQLGAKLRAEASGILNRLLEGLRDYLDQGLALPKPVQEATAEYRRDSDQIGRFLETCCEIKDGERTQSSSLLEVHNVWARANGGTEYKGPGFARALEDRGFKKEKSSVFFWLGIRLTKTVNDFVDHEGKPLKAPGGSTAPASRERSGGDEEIAF